MNIKGAIFDMDGTLVNSLFCWDVLYEKLGDLYLNGEKFIPDPYTEKAVRTMTFKDCAALLHERCNIGKSAEEIFQIGTDFLEDFYKNTVKVKDGVYEFLDHLQANGVKMCIASATEKRLVELAVKSCGLDKYIPKLISCADIGKGKEHPDAFLAALDYLGTPIEETCVFEDSFVALNTAANAGFMTVGIYDKYNFDIDKLEQKATYFIADGESLAKLI